MRLLAAVSPEHLPFMHVVHDSVRGHGLFKYAVPENFDLITFIRILKKNKVEGILCSSPVILKALLAKILPNDVTMKKNEEAFVPYRGATFDIGGIPLVIIPELDKIVKNKIAPFIIPHYIKKLTQPDQFLMTPRLDWETIDMTQPYAATRAAEVLAKFRKAKLIALDIETKPVVVDSIEAETNPLYKGLAAKTYTSKKTAPIEHVVQVITCVGFAALIEKPDGTLTSHTVVIPYEGAGWENAKLIADFCDTPAQKIMQNGKYDVTHLLVNNIPVRNWAWDTFGMMHSYLVELPRKLEFIAGFFLLNYMYWKDESGINLHEYNAKDCHQTLWAFVAMIKQYPDFAKDNYAENFKQIFPAIHCGLEGFAQDEVAFEAASEKYKTELQAAFDRLDILVEEGFNPRSPKQVLILVKALGYPTAKSTDEKSLQVFATKGTLQAVIVDAILDARGAGKLHGTYFKFPIMGGRLLYDLDPFGTETGRYASKGSSLWVGQQVQNFPQIARYPWVADEGYELSAADNGQSESRCTAYISEDENLMYAVENAEDFHKHNASMFFGKPVDEITTALRKIGKKINHGANYNMGAKVLVESMGLDHIFEAARLLDLPPTWGPAQIANYLLLCFDKAYPDIKGKYYNEVKSEIAKTGKLVGATGWTRVCLGDPSNFKPALNAYVAHGPQSLSVKIINKAYFKIWYELQYTTQKIRLKAQIHDEIIFQSKPEVTKDAIARVSEIMAEPTIVKGRAMIIPNDPVVGKRSWGELH